MSCANDPLVVFACDFEKNAFYDDKSAVTARYRSLTTGIGLWDARHVLRCYLVETSLKPTCILSVGTAASITENLHIGDVVVGGASFGDRYYEPDGRLMHVVDYGPNEKDGFGVFGGNCMTSSSPISNKGDRASAMSRFRKKCFKSVYPHLDETSDGIYICGDREAAAIAVAAKRHGIPFVAIKGI